MQIHISLCDIKHWSCYTFNLRHRVIYILDSSKTKISADIKQYSRHTWIVPMLASAMQQCLTLFFSDWKEDVTTWAYNEPVVPRHRFEKFFWITLHLMIVQDLTVYLYTSYIQLCRVESGVYTLEFMKNWNGIEVTKELNPVSHP